MSALLIMILWTWGLTPVWVNVVGTILLSVRMLIKFCSGCLKLSEQQEQKDVVHQFPKYKK